jgi:hypothetical protein
MMTKRRNWTYGQAKMTIWNPDTYTDAEVREAAAFVLGTIGAKDEDCHQAAFVAIYSPVKA